MHAPPHVVHTPKGLTHHDTHLFAMFGHRAPGSRYGLGRYATEIAKFYAHAIPVYRENQRSLRPSVAEILPEILRYK